MPPSRAGTSRSPRLAESVADASFIFICVPTPLRDGAPDLSFVEAAGRDVAAHLRRRLARRPRVHHVPGNDRPAPPAAPRAGRACGRAATSCSRTPRSGSIPATRSSRCGTRRAWSVATTPEATEAAVSFYGQLVDKVCPCHRRATAETAKLLENTFRHVNVALVNELTMLTHELDIDVWEVIDAGVDEAVRLHAVLSGAGHRRALHPAGPHLPLVAGAATDRPAFRRARGGPGRERADAELRRRPRGRDPERCRPRRQRQSHLRARRDVQGRRRRHARVARR